MRPTSHALSGRVQQLLARLHPPSPPTAKEGQQLLQVLQTSFRRELDTHHPNPRESSLSKPDKHDIPTAHDHVLSLASQTHWNSLVSHLIPTAADSGSGSREFARELDALLRRAPLDVFKVRSLLSAYSRALKAQRLRRSTETVGPTLDHWLHTTTATARELFYLGDCLDRALQVLVGEHNEALLWKWLRMVYERQLVTAKLTSRAWLTVEDKLVSSLMRIAIQRNGLHEAAHQFQQACQYRLQSGRADPGHHANPHSALQQVDMSSSGQRLASAIIWHRNNHGISATVFHDILDYLPRWRSHPDKSHVLCTIYHPTHPSYQPLYDSLSDAVEAHKVIDQQANASKATRQAVMTAMLDASKLALDGGNRAQARFLLDFAIDHYPDFLPPRQTDELEPQLEAALSLAPG